MHRFKHLLLFIFFVSRSFASELDLFHSVNVVTGQYCEAETDLVLHGPHPISLKRHFDGQGWQFNHPSILLKTIPLENAPGLKYEYDKEQRLKEIQCTSFNGAKIYNSITLSYSFEGATAQCHVSTPHEELIYRFCHFKDSLLLSEVVKEGRPICSYRYKTANSKHLLTHRIDSEGVTLVNEYYDKGDHAGKVKAQYRNADLLFRFIYHEGWTEVYDAANVKKIYRYNEQQCITAIEQYLKNEAGQERIYRIEKYYWNELGQLSSRALVDSSGRPWSCEVFEYDGQGRRTKKTLYGDLTGKGNTPWHLDAKGRPSRSNIEHCSTTYTYDKDNLLISESEDSGLTIMYDYHPTAHTLTSKQVYKDSAIQSRHFYFYDEEQTLIKTITDDGSGDSCITEFTIQTELGLPEMIVESYADQLLKRTQKEYSKKGELIREVSFDGQGNLKKCLQYTYDAVGRRTAVQDDQGHILQSIYDGAGRVIQKEAHLDDVISKTFYTYDVQGRKIAETDRFGHAITYAYDPLGRVTSITYPTVLDEQDRPVQHVETYTYDICDRVVKKINANGYATTIRYNVRGEIIETLPVQAENPSACESASKAGDRVSFDYDYYNELGQNVLRTIATDPTGILTITICDARGRKAKIVRQNGFGEILSQCELRHDGVGNKVLERHQNGFQIAWQYGPCNRLEKVIEGQRVTSYQYDARGQLQLLLKPQGISIHYQYDDEGRLSLMESSDKTICYQYAYDGQGNLATVTDLIHHTQLRRSYDSKGQIVNEVLPNGLSLTNSYNDDGLRTNLLLPDGSGVGYEYEKGKLKAVHRKSYMHTYDYNESQLVKAHMIGGLGEILYSYDAKQRFAGLKSPFWSEAIPSEGYDSKGNLLCEAIEDVVGQKTSHYAYDDRQQLISADEEAFHYDALGNLYFNNTPAEISACCEVARWGNEEYVYNANGCLIETHSPQGKTTYAYDALDRLIAVYRGDSAFYYGYDAFNRRITKQQMAWNAGTNDWIEVDQIRFLYDGDKEIGAVDRSGKLVELRLLGLGLGAELGSTVAIELQDAIYAPIHDHRGSIRCLIDLATGAKVETYRYTAWGTVSAYDSDGNALEFSKNPWQFAGKRIDPETGFIYFGARYYAPERGRWITPDPAGFIDSPNRYAYVKNNPILGTDPYGLFSWGSIWGEVWDAYSYINNLRNQLSLYQYAEPDIIDQLFGHSFLAMVGYYTDPGEMGVYGNGEIGGLVRITTINGILNLRNHCMDAVQLLSKTHGDVNVHYIYNPSGGWTWDLVKAIFVKCGYISPEAYQLAHLWKSLINEMGGPNGGGLIIHYAHSIGGTNTLLAKKLLTPDELRMIRIITIGSATMIHDGDFESVMNYVSVRDAVCFFDPLGHLNGNGDIVYLGSLYGVPLIDHLLFMETYHRLITYLGSQFVEHYSNKN